MSGAAPRTSWAGTVAVEQAWLPKPELASLAHNRWASPRHGILPVEHVK